ncbi:MAG: hypothetical protein HRT88_09850, partial [Lentisphaeraceae bacterium]|nr:hypothetical protein [Lentisphaeraceae bacterium]
ILGLQKVPKKAAPFYFGAHAYKLANETEKSQKALTLAKIYNMASENLIASTADFLSRRGLYDYYIENLQRLCILGPSMTPQHTRAFSLRLNDHISNQKYQAAGKTFIQYYTRICSNPKNISPQRALILGHQLHEFKLRQALKNKDSVAAEKALTKCLSIMPQNIELSIILHQTPLPELKKKSTEVFKIQWSHLQSLLKKYPANAMLLNTAAWLGALCNYELELCRQYSHRSVDSSPSAAAYDTLSEVYSRLNRPKEAMQYIEKAISIDKLEPFYKKRLKKLKSALNKK